MKHKEHRLGVSEVNLVKRQLGLRKPIISENLNAAIAEIDKLYGLDNVVFHEGSCKINFSYDASRLCLQCVEDILVKYDIPIKRDWWTRFKEGYYLFVDQNVKDNAQHEPWSCHRVPPHTRR
ncbi:cation transporter [Marinimicrobium sp. C2-29]|uniref:cation transporter n=1 Tax=Marinimicrobium sp. C2-29 TaxID=3139825 RepID=UPI00313A45C5